MRIRIIIFLKYYRKQWIFAIFDEARKLQNMKIDENDTVTELNYNVNKSVANIK